MSDSVLTIERRDGIEIVTLNRPEALNALNVALVTALSDYFRALHERHEIRVVILRAAGRAFCAGVDLTSGGVEKKGSPVHDMWRTQRSIAQVMQLMRSCPQPIIGLGHGAACGGGFSLLLSCDVRYGAPSLKMNAAYIKIGLSGCDMGSSYFLPRLAGASVAAEFILTGRFIDAQRAYRSNLISEIVPDDQLLDHGLALAADMLATAPMGLRLSKDALNRNIDAPSFEAALAIEDRQQVMLTMTEDCAEAVDAFRNKRRPRYADR